MTPRAPSRPPRFGDDATPPPEDEAGAEDGLWFLPGTAEDADDAPGPHHPPLPRASRARLVDPAEWRAAEAALAQDLAALAHDHGRLEERAARFGPGAVSRLAQAEASAISWWAGDRVQPDRLAQWLAFRIGAAGEDGGGLIRAAWAARRLTAAPVAAPSALLPPLPPMAAHLGMDPAHPLAAEAAAALPAAGDLGPVALGCAAFHLWKGLQERPAQLAGIEAAVLGARLAAGPARGLPFLPLALTGFGALTVSGGAERRLAGWIAGAHQAVLSALLTLERLRGWQDRAAAATEDLTGRTPARLIACLARHPLVAAPLAETETGASRAAVQRNLDRLMDRGLIREVTGQGRFRLWAARL